MSLSGAELERYARHIVLHEVGGPGQARLKAADVLVVGAGGLGAPILLYLAAAGVGRLACVDDDRVSLSNLQRQVIHRTDGVGRAKVESAGDAVAALNPHVAFEGIDARLDDANAEAMIAGRTLVIDGSDSYATRAAVNRACLRAGVPLLVAAIGRWEGQVTLLRPGHAGPCYACLFPTPLDPALVPACAEAGVLGAMAGVVGTMAAVEAVKTIVGSGRTAQGRLMIYDALEGEMRSFATERRADCAVCGA